VTWIKLSKYHYDTETRRTICPYPNHATWVNLEHVLSVEFVTTDCDIAIVRLPVDSVASVTTADPAQVKALREYCESRSLK
jgi:hypothetical protein